MPSENPNSVTRIQELNNFFRRSFIGGMVVVTAGFEFFPADRRGLILAKGPRLRSIQRGQRPTWRA